MYPRSFSIIVGYRASDRAIGANGQLPWHITKDMVFFRKTTLYVEPIAGLDAKNVVIMGRTTFESMHSRPLGGRINIVCTSKDITPDMPDIDLYFVKSLDAALELCHKMGTAIHKIFVIGGEQLYRFAVKHPLCRELIVNEFSPVHTPTPTMFDLDAIKCDAFFPEIDEREYEMVLDYSSIDSIAEIRPTTTTTTTTTTTACEQEPECDHKMYCKIRYKKFIRIETKCASPKLI